MFLNKLLKKKLINNEYQALYFIKEKKLLEKVAPKDIIVIQWFQRHDDVMVCGIKESLEHIKLLCQKKIKILALNDGDIVSKNEIVLAIEGYAYEVAPLEGLIDSILTRSTSIATNCHQLKVAAKDKEIIYMGDRADHYLTQHIDGYAASVGGISKQVTNEQVSLFGNKNNVVGSIPHSLIQVFAGNLIETLNVYKNYFPKDNLIGLVDFENDCVETTKQIALAFKEKLFAIRIDTAKNMIDKYFDKVDLNLSKEEQYGANIHLIRGIRAMLDSCECHHTKIIISSGLTPSKIKYFIENNAPIDIFGVGAFTQQINIHFTGDAVKLNGSEIAKAGRKIGDFSRLNKIN